MIKEIQCIKNLKLIALDFDDCIIEWTKKINNKWIANSPEEVKRNLLKNLKIIKLFCKKYNFKVFITSSWSKVINDELTLKKDKVEEIHKELWEIIKNELSIIGKDPFNDRILVIEVLLDNNNKIIVIDDMDLSHYFPNEIENGQLYMLNIFNGIGLEKLNEIKF